MKTTIERIFQTLSKEKVELKSEKIKLANISELNRFVGALTTALKQLQNNRSKLGKDLREIEKIKESLKINYNTAVKNQNATKQALKSAEQIANEISKQAKELGINPKSIDNVEELISLVEQVEGTQETIDSFINMAKRFL